MVNAGKIIYNTVLKFEEFMLSNYSSLDVSYHEFIFWLSTPVGKEFINTEGRCINEVYKKIAKLHGMLVLGNDLFFQEMTKHISKVCIDFHLLDYKIKNISEVYKLKCDNYSVVYMPHLLEFSVDPKLMLTIASEVVCDGGYLIITNFNVFSLLGISKLNKKNLDHWPYSWIVGFSLASYIKKLCFSFVQIKYFAYGLPYNISCYNYGGLLPFGGAYLLVLQKQSIPLSLVMA